jgi:hypothetical protein
MFCPTCSTSLEDSLDFTQETLCCPSCGRAFTEQEILHLPMLSDIMASFAPLLSHAAPRTTIIAAEPVYL